MKHPCFAAWSLFILATISWAQSNPQPLVYPSLVPVSTAPGGPAFSLTVNGAGFVAGAVVQWNGSPRTTTFISGSSVQAAITASDIATASTALITVVNPAPGGGTSNLVYFPVTEPEATVSVALDSALTTSAPAEGIAVADFNGDGILDMVVGVTLPGSQGSDILFYQGKGNGAFKSPVISHSTLTQLSIGVGDFNGDGKPDLLASGFIEPDVYSAVYLNNGDGTFSQQGFIPDLGDYGSPAAQGDFTGSGKLDLIGNSCTQGSCYLVYLAGDGKGTFPSHHNIGGLNQFSGSVAVGDFNGDGKLDFAIPGLIFLGNGDGTFQNPKTIANVTGDYILAADLNGDGKLDLVTNGVCVLLGNGDGTFNTTCFPQDYVYGPIFLGDFNGEGKLDLAADGLAAYPSIGQIEVLSGNGDGTFQTAAVAGANTSAAVVADFNNDGKLDFGNAGTTGVLQYLQSAGSLAPLSLFYSTQGAGTTSPAQVVTVSNSGSTALKIASVAIGGVNSSEFAAVSHCGSSVAAGGSCDVNIVFKPTTFGFQYATLTVTYANGAKTSQVVELSGNGSTTNASFSPTTLAFGYQIVGTSSAPMTATLTNAGPETLTISGFTSSQWFNFTTNCGSTLAVNASCEVFVTFAPTAAVGYGGTLSANTNAQNGSLMVQLSGIGTNLLVSPLSINFGNQAVGTSSAPATVTLTNESSTQPVSIGPIDITGERKDFTETTNCTQNILPGTSCTISVTFTPSVKGARSASLPINMGALGVETVSLSGTGT
jgi:hypothetical protein